MKRHPLDTLSAAFGVVTVVAAALVMTRSLDAVSAGNGWWLALLALVVGLGLIPWSARRPGSGGLPDDQLGAGDEGGQPE